MKLIFHSSLKSYSKKLYKSHFFIIFIFNALVPQRIALTDPAPGLTLIMPGIIGGKMNTLATKIVSVYKQNPEKYNLPTVLAKIMVKILIFNYIISFLNQIICKIKKK